MRNCATFPAFQKSIAIDKPSYIEVSKMLPVNYDYLFLRLPHLDIETEPWSEVDFPSLSKIDTTPLVRPVPSPLSARCTAGRIETIVKWDAELIEDEQASLCHGYISKQSQI